MIKFDLPKDLNCTQLIGEIEAKGIAVDKSVIPLIDGNEDFWLPVEESDREAVTAVIKKHKPVVVIPTVADKLAAAGISLDELKVALGL
jgi:hypothetical protein